MYKISMTPGARTQASIDLLDQIFTSWKSDKRFPADKQIDQYFKSHRFIGSKDRATIGELVYWVMRHKASLEWWATRGGLDTSARSLVLAAVIIRKEYRMQTLKELPRDSQYSIRPLTDQELHLAAMLEGQPLAHADMPVHVRLNYPEWMSEPLQDCFGKDFELALNTLNEQASTDIRVNTLKTSREALQQQLKNEGFETIPTPVSHVGLRLEKRGPIFTSTPFQQGHFEVQDEGSQIVAYLVDAKPGDRVIDFCAGAGGKTLAIAAQMENKGRILAWDTSEKRLGQITLRLRRAGVGNVQTHVLKSEHDSFIKRHKQTADRVLVDAPCSGTGTWRRNPDLKWRFTRKDLEEVCEIQQSILASAARLVKPGGRLIYATCSVLKEENEQQIEKFLKSVNDFRVVCAQKIWDKTLPEDSDAVSYLWVTPHQDGVDGFFAAVLERLPAADLKSDDKTMGEKL